LPPGIAMHWVLECLPHPGSGSTLDGVATILSASDIWAVGDDSAGYPNPDQTLIEHWNGTQWGVVFSPNSNTDDALYGVAAVSTDDVWAVGTEGDPLSGFYGTLIEQWNGTNWNIVTSPSPGSFSNQLQAAAAIPGADQLVAVGYQGYNQPLGEYYCSTPPHQ
jgi:hypothetical protein